jgi:2'-5' RNA ligase
VSIESTIYDSLWQKSLAQFKRGECETDPLILHEEVPRKGRTLLARIPNPASAEIMSFLEELRGFAPDQHFCQPTNMHLTVLAIISCHVGFKRRAELDNAYRSAISECLQEIPAPVIEFRGITASPSCVLIQGFMRNDSLNEIRHRLRERFQSSDLPHSIDSRYAIQTAHITAMRLQREPKDLQGLVRFLEANQGRAFGTVALGTLEFVVNDWYQRAENTEKIAPFSLPS